MGNRLSPTVSRARSIDLDLDLDSMPVLPVWLLEIKMKIQGSWIISPRNVVVTDLSNSVEMDQDHRAWTWLPAHWQCNKKNSKKMLCKYEKSRILIAMKHFSMDLLWGQLQRDFLRFVNWTRPSGRRGNFYQVAQGQHPLLCALSTAESLSCPKSIGSIGGSTIFQSQQYSTCPKARTPYEFANRQLGDSDAGMYS